jgi:uncharacterized membrane protein YraQ (UPF0718 family)
MLSNILDQILFEWLSFIKGSQLGNAIHFFIYDIIIITLLLIFITIIMGVINSYFPVEILKHKLKGKKLFGLDNFFASILGAITPFCSCSSIPLFIGFLKGGIPLGVTFSFLITSPLVNEVALVLLWGLFGFKVAMSYALSGILIGTILGQILGRFNLEKYLEAWILSNINSSEIQKTTKQPFKENLPFILNDALGLSKKLIPYILIGVFVGAFIYGYVPAQYFEQYMSAQNILAVPLATILAIPMYTNATGILPIIQSLVSKGIPMGTSLAFMMAVVGLSLPEAMMLKKVMKVKLIVIFFTIVGIAIIFTGYLFNLYL